MNRERELFPRERSNLVIIEADPTPPEDFYTMADGVLQQYGKGQLATAPFRVNGTDVIQFKCGIDRETPPVEIELVHEDGLARFWASLADHTVVSAEGAVSHGIALKAVNTRHAASRNKAKELMRLIFLLKTTGPHDLADRTVQDKNRLFQIDTTLSQMIDKYPLRYSPRPLVRAA